MFNSLEYNNVNVTGFSVGTMTSLFGKKERVKSFLEVKSKKKSIDEVYINK